MGADRLGAKGPTCGTELHIRTGAGKRERLRTTRGVVGHGHGACQRAFGLGLEGHGDRATGPWIHSRAASVRLSEWTGCSDAPNSQNPEAGVGQRRILSPAGRKDRLVRKSQAAVTFSPTSLTYPEAGVGQRRILSPAGRKDRLVRKSQAGWRERHGRRYAHARERSEERRVGKECRSRW